jgi:hypothetical protein
MFEATGNYEFANKELKDTKRRPGPRPDPVSGVNRFKGKGV